MRLSDAEFDEVRRHGLAAYLVAGPALQRKLMTKRHALGESGSARKGWRSCMPRSTGLDADAPTQSAATLRALWPDFLQAGTTPNDDRFAIGLEWALRRVAATVALLQQDHHGSRAYDYVIRLVDEQPAADPPRAPVWAAAIGSATPEQALVVGFAAFAHLRLDDAEAALRRARDSSSAELAALAEIQLGFVLALQRRPQEALAAFQQVIDDYRDDPAPHCATRSPRR